MPLGLSFVYFYKRQLDDCLQSKFFCNTHLVFKPMVREGRLVALEGGVVRGGGVNVVYCGM